MRSTRTLLATGVAAALLLAACGGEEPSADEAASPSAGVSAAEPTDEPSDEPTEEETEEPAEEESDKPRPQGPFADLVFDGDAVSPNGERLELGLDQPLTLRIDSDRAGELHVHSTPERVIKFPAGQSERQLRIGQPGVVEVEEHDSGKILLQLEVR